jgi:hypothetical protein
VEALRGAEAWAAGFCHQNSTYRVTGCGASHWRATRFAPPWKGRSPNSLPIVMASTLKVRATSLLNQNRLWASIGSWYVCTLRHLASLRKLHDRALVRTQLDAAAHRLALTVTSGGYEQPPGQFA